MNNIGQNESRRARKLITAAMLIDALANHSCAAPKKIVDLLTEYLFTEEEAEEIKAIVSGPFV